MKNDIEIVQHKYTKINTVLKRELLGINRIVLHCAATHEGKDYTVYDIDRWHKARKFSCIGYHYIIYRDGTIHQGRKEDEVGSHTSGFNSKSIGICYIGGLEKDTDKAKDTRTPEQKKALISLVSHLLEKYRLTLDDVYGHYQLTTPYGAKACPSFKIEQFKKEYINETTEK